MFATKAFRHRPAARQRSRAVASRRASPRDPRRVSREQEGAPGSNWTSTSTSLSGPKSSRRTDPKRARRWMWCRVQKRTIASLGNGIWTTMLQGTPHQERPPQEAAVLHGSAHDQIQGRLAATGPSTGELGEKRKRKKRKRRRLGLDALALGSATATRYTTACRPAQVPGALSWASRQAQAGSPSTLPVMISADRQTITRLLRFLAKARLGIELGTTR